MEQLTNYSHDDETIVALSTPRGTGALALIRLSGADVLPIVANMSKLSNNKNIITVPTHTIHAGWVIDGQQQPIDKVMFAVMRGPSTFTGQDSVEITAHNNPFIIEAIIEEAIQRGARLAHEGEFTKRAFLQGKIDLIQAEAINDLLSAQTTQALKQSLAQLQGSFSSWIATLEEELITALAWSEASFEFLDEEREFGEHIRHRLTAMLSKIITLKKSFNLQQQLRQGIRIALIGSVNAGKSSIFNALVGDKRAIVTDIAGTTRDSIEAGMYRHGNFWTLIDTAGLRTTNDVIEQEGIKRSYEEAHKADIILLVIDGSRPLEHHEKTTYQYIYNTYQSKIICLQNKSDLPPMADASLLFPLVPLLTNIYTPATGVVIEQEISNKINQLFLTANSPYLLNQRHYNLLVGVEQKLLHTLSLATAPSIPYELISYHLRDAAAHMSELTGKSITEAGLDKVFKEFCVGK